MVRARDFNLISSDILGERKSNIRGRSRTQPEQAYLSRLKNGKRKNRSPETIMKISLAFTHWSKDIKLYEIEKLLNSVGRSIYMNSNNI